MEMQVNNKRIYLKILIPVLVLVLLLGGSYAFFNYTRTGRANTLIVGNIYLNHNQGTEISLTNEFPSKVENARARNDNTVTITVTGYNESDRDIYYKLLLNHGDTVDGRDRIRDDLLRFDLVEILANNEEKYILYNEKFDTINNTIMLKDRVDANTSPSNQVTRTYKLRMWIDHDTLISDTDENRDYTSSEYENLFASVKITAKGQTEKVYYYESFGNAIAAVNDEDYASETNRANAVIGIYIDADDNSTNLVFYDNDEIDNRYTISNPIDINLYGYTLTFVESEGQGTTSVTLNSESVLENGHIDGRGTYNTKYYNNIVFNSDSAMRNIDLQANYLPQQLMLYIGAINSNLLVENCTLGVYGGATSYLNSNSNANVIMKNDNFYGNMNIIAGSTIELNDSDIYSSVDYDYTGISYSIMIRTGSYLIVNNSRIFSDSIGCYYIGDATYANASIGIQNAGTMIFNSGYVFGTHSAVSTGPGSKTYVYGGTFESTDHGGFYFGQGPSGIAYIENANLNGIDYPLEGKRRPNGTVASSITINGTTYTLSEIKSAFYIGGNQSQNGETVYMINCNISSKKNQVFTMRSSTPEQYLYMSGCKFNNTTTLHHIRIDMMNTMRLYVGANNDFGNINTFGGTTYAAAKEQGTIVETNANYKNIVRPE